MVPKFFKNLKSQLNNRLKIDTLINQAQGRSLLVLCDLTFNFRTIGY